MAFNFLIVLSHGVRHTFENICVFAWMHCCHWYVLKEWKRLNSQSFVEILFLDVLFDQLIIDWFSLNVSSTEKHSGSKVVFIINDVHCIKPNILLFQIFFLFTVQDYNFISIFCLDCLLISSNCGTNSLFAHGFFMNQVLFLFIEIFRSEIRIRWRFPHPTFTNLHYNTRFTSTKWLPAFLNSLGDNWPLI